MTLEELRNIKGGYSNGCSEEEFKKFIFPVTEKFKNIIESFLNDADIRYKYKHYLDEYDHYVYKFTFLDSTNNEYESLSAYRDIKIRLDLRVKEGFMTNCQLAVFITNINYLEECSRNIRSSESSSPFFSSVERLHIELSEEYLVDSFLNIKNEIDKIKRHNENFEKVCKIIKSKNIVEV